MASSSSQKVPSKMCSGREMPAATEPMDPELRDIMMDQPEGVNDFLRKVGVQTCVDMREEDAASADSRRKHTTSVETLIRLTGLTPLPMHSALAFVERINRYVDTDGAVLGSTCFVCLDAVDVDDGTTIVPFAKTGVCGLCQRSLLEDETTENLKGFKCLSSDGVKAIQLFLLLLEGIRESEHWMQPLGVTAQQSCFVCGFLRKTVDDVELFHDGATVGLK